MSRFRAARATVDWSHSLLDDDERRLFRRLTVFPLHFSADATRHIAAPEHEEPWRVTDLLADLIAKSLLLSDVAGSAPQYRFLETIRFYALEKLADSGEVASTAERHASANPDSLSLSTFRLPMRRFLLLRRWRRDSSIDKRQRERCELNQDKATPVDAVAERHKKQKTCGEA
jgi:hypothetical protein